MRLLTFLSFLASVFRSARYFFIISVIIAFSGIWNTADARSSRTVSGKVVDVRNRKGLSNVNVSVMGSSIGTVTNSDGDFSLYMPDAENARVVFSTIGYSSLSIASDSLRNKNNLIRLERLPVELSEITVYGGDPEKIIEAALKRIPKNYSQSADMLSMFYRETIRKGRRFIGVSEAAIDVYKTKYDIRKVDFDRVRIDRGRRLINQKSSDTLAVKIMGGPNLAVNIDFVKNADILFSEKDLTEFEFKMEKPEFFDDRLQYVISFRPKEIRNYAQFRGKVYIDQMLLAFTRAEFEILPDDKKKMAETIVRRKPRGLRFTPQKIGFVVSYKLIDGKTYLNYISNEMRFKCDMKRKLFSSAYTIYAEMVVVDRIPNTAERISYKNSFKPLQVFYDLVDEYWDENYWSDYNIIEPTESLENSVEKLKKNR